ncbi:MAG: VCBS repeat-containing protein [Alphaproteobacteria bacterium]|nr:VCBS repeat-containing protein [Alphaproteobacteria bacterium]
MRWTLLLALALPLIPACKDGGDAGDDTANVGTDGDGDGYAPPQDCDDANPDVNPGATEVCDGIDNNCDGSTDGADAEGAETWYFDGDGDGYGDDSTAQDSCPPEGQFVQVGGDCDDSDAAYNPGATEDDCTDPNDYNCDGSVGYADADADGVPACEDCDDANADAYPGNTEVCDDVDNDCNGLLDDDAVDATTWFEDRDGDGYGNADASVTTCDNPSGYVTNDDDCDDTDPVINPDTIWHLDYDGDTYGSPDFTLQQCEQPNGYVLDDSDCDDADASLNPDAIWYDDDDGDGYGDATAATVQCEQPAGTVTDATDCDDGSASVHPGAPEYCDTIDQDCDGTVDDADSLDANTYYRDSDSDGYGNASSTTTACSAPFGYVSDDTDCYDSDANAYPGSHATETPGDGIDTDCDGNDDCDDLNCDGYPDVVFPNYYDGSGYNIDSFVYYGGSSGFSSSNRDDLPTSGVHTAHVHDFDNDGYLDILFVNYYDGNYSADSYIYYGSASGFSSSNRDEIAGVGAIDACVEDLDSDGYLDIVLANYYNGSNYATDPYIYWGSSAGFSASNRTTLSGQRGARECVIQDLDSDGYPDIVFASYRYSTGTESTTSYIFWGSSAGWSSADVTGLSGYRTPHVDIADVDADGYPDILLSTYYDGNYSTNSYLYWGSSAGYSSSDRTNLGTLGAWDAVIADFDNDGNQDIAFASYANASSDFSGNYNYVYFQVTPGSFSSSNRNALQAYGTRYISAADLDGDGYTDLVTSNLRSSSSNFETNSYVFWGSSSGFSNSSRDDLPTKYTYRHAIGDVDLDGYPDIVFGNYRNNSSSYTIDSPIYYGSAGSYGTTNQALLAGEGVWGQPVIVGGGDW